ncbi:unnamed protein product [Musa hybrid cultivar]
MICLRSKPIINRPSEFDARPQSLLRPPSVPANPSPIEWTPRGVPSSVIDEHLENVFRRG